MDGQPGAQVEPQHKDADESKSWASTIKDGAARLVDEAYEHPGKAALVAAGVVAVGAAAFATKGRSLFANKSVLLVEDTPFMGRAMQSALENQGHNVTWVTGVQRPAPFTAMMPDGTTKIIDTRKFKAAFVDGDLEGSYLQGHHVVDALKKDGVPSIGTSTLKPYNRAMLDNGAVVASSKPSIYSEMLSPNFNLTDYLKRSAETQKRLDSLRVKLGTPEGRELRRAADETLKGFL